MLEIVVSGIGGGLLYISQNGFRMLDGKVPQKAAAVFPEFEVGYLGQVLYQRSGRLAPQGGRSHHGKTDRPSDPGNELLPGVIIPRSCAKTDDVLQGQR